MNQIVMIKRNCAINTIPFLVNEGDVKTTQWDVKKLIRIHQKKKVVGILIVISD